MDSAPNNKLLWELNEKMYKEKKVLDQKLADLERVQEEIKLEKERMAELNASLWKQSEAIHQEKERINKLKLIIEHKHQEMIDSVTYAKRIQTAILPTNAFFFHHLPDSFVLYKPKDIVAGDFYWMEPVGDSMIIFAAADCTGHGVPGAMVSVICSNALNRAVKEYHMTEPANILYKTRDIVIERFERSEEEVKDGMDVSLCNYNKTLKVLQYSGAQNPLWIVSRNPNKVSSEKEVLNARELGLTAYDLYLHEIKPNKQPIGKYAELSPFTNHSIQMEAGDIIYLFSDGYADQFGGPKGKKFKYSTFKELILSVYEQPMAEQRQIIDQRFEEWRGELEQIDDVCVIGVRIN